LLLLKLQSVTRLHSAFMCKMAERIDVLFGVNTVGGPRNIVLDGGPHAPTVREGGSTFNAAFVNLLLPLALYSVMPCNSASYMSGYKGKR